MNFFGSDVDYPYRLLNLNKDYSLKQLKSQFKKMVAFYHPHQHENVTQSHSFLILNLCYKYLLHEYCKKHNVQLPTGASPQRYVNSQQTKPHEMPLAPPIDVEKVTPEVFNEIFRKYHYKNSVDGKGYADWLKKLNENAIHEQQDPESTNKSNGPQPLCVAHGLGPYYELGGSYTDFSGCQDGLAYCDLKLALTKSQKIIQDEELKKIRMPKYNGLTDIQREREKPLVLSRHEQEALHAQTMLSLNEEKMRLKRLQKEQARINQYHHQTANLFP